MNKNKDNKTDEMNWSEFQKKYFDALTAFSTPTSNFTNNTSEKSFWNNAMNDWWNTVKTGSLNENEGLFEKVINQSRNYYFMGEQFSSLIEGLSNFKGKDKDLVSFINNKFKELESMVSQTSTNFSWSSFIDASEMPYEWMNKNQSNDVFNFSDLFGSINPEIKKMREQILSMPGIGHSRESQDKLKKLVKLGALYQDNTIENQTVMTRLSGDALELMRKKILRMSKKGEDFNSMRQIYDLWVESNEKVYEDYAFTKEYSELNGRLVNSQMAFKKLSHEINEDIMTSLNMPTTRAMNEIERRHYELRKKVKAMELELKSLKEIINGKESTVKKEPTIPIKKKITKKTPKKKVTKKKVSKKNTAKKKVTKKKIIKTARPVKKKAKRKTSGSKKDVIEIKL